MGFYPKHVVVNDALRPGVKFLPIDLRYSHADVVVEGNAIRLSLGDVHGFGPEQIEIIETERQRGPFRSLNELVRRTTLDRPHVEALVLSGALDYLGERRQLLWDIAEAYRLAKRPRELPLRSVDGKCPPTDGSSHSSLDGVRADRHQFGGPSHGTAPQSERPGRYGRTQSRSWCSCPRPGS